MTTNETPFISVYYGVTKISSLLVDFVYKYSEDEDDTAQLKFQSTEPSISDKPEFQEDAILRLVWGYINGPSVTRTVKVLDTRLLLNDKIISIDLLCTDLASKTKADARNRVWENADIADVLAQAGNDNNLTPSIDPDSVPGGIGSVTIDVKRRSFYDAGAYVSPKDNMARPRTYSFRKYEVLPQGNQSDFQLLKRMAKDEPNGPWKVVGRDDSITLKKIDLSQPPLRSYSYKNESGELLEFTPEEKGFSKKQSATELGFTGFDSENKAGFEGSANSTNTTTSPLAEYTDSNPKPKEKTGIEKIISSAGNRFLEVITPPLIFKPSTIYNRLSPVMLYNTVEELKPTTKDELAGDMKQNPEAISSINTVIVDPDSIQPKNLKEYVELRKNSKNQLSLEQAPEADIELNDSLGTFTLVNYSTSKYDYYYKNNLNGFDGVVTEVDNTAIASRYATYGVKDRKKISTPETDPAEAQRAANNEQDEKALEKNPGKVRVIGDVTLKSGIILGFINVGKKYSGNYYIPECTHNINRSGGYIVEMVIKRNGINKPDETPVNKTSVKDVPDPGYVNRKVTKVIESDDEWIGVIMDFEFTKGAADGTGLPNYGYNSRNNEIMSLPPDQRRQKAIDLFKQDYLPKLTEYKYPTKALAGDYIYNTGRNFHDLFLYSDRVFHWLTLDQINSNDTFEVEWRRFGGNMVSIKDVEMINLISDGKLNVYKTTGINPSTGSRYTLANPNPAFYTTWKSRVETMRTYLLNHLTNKKTITTTERVRAVSNGSKVPNNTPPPTQNASKVTSTNTSVQHYKNLGFIDKDAPDNGTLYKTPIKK